MKANNRIFVITNNVLTISHTDDITFCIEMNMGGESV